MERNKIIIGSRASKLALIYADKAREEISKYFTGEIIIEKIVLNPMVKEILEKGLAMGIKIRMTLIIIQNLDIEIQEEIIRMLEN